MFPSSPKSEDFPVNGGNGVGVGVLVGCGVLVEVGVIPVEQAEMTIRNIVIKNSLDHFINNSPGTIIYFILYGL